MSEFVFQSDQQCNWRLVLSPPGTGAWNMALDESILEHCGAGKSLPTLRLYSWQPGCLSLGFSQPFSKINLDALRQHGWDYVRRPTGGQAVLHIDELTYSAIAPYSDPRMTGSVLDVYQRISLGLLEALKILGLEPKADSIYENSKKNSKNPVCFENPSNYEITVSGLKLVGSAQARKFDAILQHGSIPIYGDITRILSCFLSTNSIEQAKERLLRHAANLEMILGEAPSFSQVQQAVIAGFSQALNLKFIQSDPLESEISRARELLLEKYQNDLWTKRIL